MRYYDVTIKEIKDNGIQKKPKDKRKEIIKNWGRKVVNYYHAKNGKVVKMTTFSNHLLDINHMGKTGQNAKEKCMKEIKTW